MYIDCALDKLNQPKGTKTGTTRVVLLPVKTQRALSAWHDLTKWKAPSDFIFSAGPGEPHGDKWLIRALPRTIERLNEKAKEKKLPPVVDTTGRSLVVHSFRHTFVSAVRNVAPDEIARAMSGHVTEKALDIYTHRTAADLLERLEPAREAVEKLWAEAPSKDKPQKLTSPGGAS